ncbi:MAG: ABC transporter substrate-binding protein, partial [Candidatus Rokubacteria bacterium]|nr:ABC transporter substrate-binding protein [Candidatus Rokubacteria bacterium]
MKHVTWLAAAGIAVCIVAGQPGVGTAQKTTTIRVGDQIGSELDYGPYWIAVEKGYFREEGITTVRRTYPNGPATLLDYNKGEVDALMAGLGPYIQAAAQGSDFVVLMSITKGNAPLVARPEIRSAKDLNGKRVGTPGLGTIHDTMLTLYEKAHGIKVEHVSAKITDLVAMLEKGEVAGVLCWETVAATTVRSVKGAHYLAPLPVIPGAESLQVVLNRQIVKSSPDVALGFTRALVKGMRYYEKHEDEGLRLIAKAMNFPDALEVARLGKGQVKITDPYMELK